MPGCLTDLGLFPLLAGAVLGLGSMDFTVLVTVYPRQGLQAPARAGWGGSGGRSLALKDPKGMHGGFVGTPVLLAAS